MFGHNHETSENPTTTTDDVTYPDGLGHSGKLGLEKPPKKGLLRRTDRFRNTPLPEAPVNPVPHTPESLVTPPWYKKRAAKVAGGILALTAVIGGGAVLGGGDADIKPRTEPSASAPANPGGEVSPDNEPVSINGIETRPSTEQLRLAETPVTNRDFPTIEEAYPALLERLNVYTTGADVDFSTTPVVETPESIESGEKLLDVVYGPDRETRAEFDLSAVQAVRNLVGLKFYYLYEIQDKEATFRYDSDVTSIEKTSVPGATEAYIVHSIHSTTSNIPELDPTGHEFDPMVSNTYEQESTVALSPDGNWYFERINNLE